MDAAADSAQRRAAVYVRAAAGARGVRDDPHAAELRRAVDEQAAAVAEHGQRGQAGP